ncbi:MAG: hypothetical protein RLZZ618_1389 [Pseudomonadota bacterium]|jgi:hypothetical protein
MGPSTNVIRGRRVLKITTKRAPAEKPAKPAEASAAAARKPSSKVAEALKPMPAIKPRKLAKPGEDAKPAKPATTKASAASTKSSSTAKPVKASNSSKPSDREGVVKRVLAWLHQQFGSPDGKAALESRLPKDPALALTSAEARLIRQDLAAVLDLHPSARTVMRFVRALEHGLRKKGKRTLDELPVEILRRALAQLDAVVTDWSPAGLALLRSRAALAIARRDRVALDRQDARTLAAYNEVQVEEASHTVFLEANEEWERSFTGRTEAGALDALKTTAATSSDSPAVSR